MFTNKKSDNTNTGDCNTGNRNTGYCNSGSCNTGSCNTGDYNTGDYNTGSWNTGDYNTGNWNTGDYNTGEWNTGEWNTGNYNSGYCNTTEPNTVRIFNKEVKVKRGDINFPGYFYFDTTEWIIEPFMTDKEKEENPTYKATGGYLRSFTNNEAWRISWDKASDEDRRKTLDLPGWDNELFKEISGIDVELELSCRCKCQCCECKGNHGECKYCPNCGIKLS